MRARLRRWMLRGRAAPTSAAWPSSLRNRGVRRAEERENAVRSVDVSNGLALHSCGEKRRHAAAFTKERATKSGHRRGGRHSRKRRRKLGRRVVPILSPQTAKRQKLQAPVPGDRGAHLLRLPALIERDGAGVKRREGAVCRDEHHAQGARAVICVRDALEPALGPAEARGPQSRGDGGIKRNVLTSGRLSPFKRALVNES